ncbi:MAG TPA: (deoxy)nucleoside triphosphate pyrophosphohydrolase [Bacteroidales bacterium]|nr:(deoxy)nucleoside triphosphate pyrophosphohydrolase [Bacteroidales bacterium]
MINVTCAIIRNEDDEILIVQRGEHTDHPLKWEFPGGKVHKNESDEECIIREIKEELSIEIVICSRLQNVEHDYGHKQIRLIPFVCDTLDDLPLLSEHVDFKWIETSKLLSVDFSEADVSVAENYLNTTGNISKPVAEYASEEEQALKDDADLKNMVNNLMGIKEAEWVAASAIDNPEIFKKLMVYSFSPDKKLAFRSSWTLTKVCDKYPELIFPHLTSLVEALPKIDNESVQRSFLRIVSLTDLHKIGTKHHGMLADYCFTSLRSGFTAIAIKAYAMEALYKLALVYPELANELSATINMIQGEGSAGIIARGRIILKRLAEIH